MARRVFVFLVLYFSQELSRSFADELYSNTWVVYTEKGKEYVDKIARKRGFINHGQSGGLEGYYILEHKSISKRTRRSLDLHTQDFLREPHIKYAQQQKVLSRKKRGYVDPYYPDQWYLHNTGQTPGPKGLDINVLSVWKKNISGKNVVVTILDDGIEYTHPDLKENYEASASWDFNGHDSDPIPRYSADNVNKHGTRCAGEVAAKSGNNICGVGVAYNARIGGVRMLDGDVTDVVEGGSLSLKTNFIDIYSSSWGPDDDGRTVDGPGPLAKKAFRDGIRKGRKGLGSIFVWATGNGGRYNDYCSCDGYITSIFTISIGAVNDRGKSPWYAEPCPSTLAVTYSSGEARGPDLKIVTTDLNFKCTKEHTGTSAAAPLAAGIFALVLEANPNLSWRDLQHLIVKTSKKTDQQDSEWQVNGAGHHVNNKYGFGVLDAGALVDLAQDRQWKMASEQHICRELGSKDHHVLPKKGTYTSSLYTSGCEKKVNCITRLEHVRVYITLSHPRRGTLSITLISPSGTKSELLKQRSKDYSGDGFQNWPFMTVFSWGENPKGIWTLKVTDHADFDNQGILKRWSLRMYGTCVEPNPNITMTEKLSCKDHCKVGCPVSFSQSCRNCSQYCHCDTGRCVKFCNEEDEVDEVARQCLPSNAFTEREKDICLKNCKDSCPATQFCNCQTGHCLNFCDKDAKVDPEHHRCMAPNTFQHKGNNSDDMPHHNMSTFYEWLLVFGLLAVLLAAILALYLFKARSSFCWSRPALSNSSPQRNVSYAPVSLSNPEPHITQLTEQRALVTA